MIEHTNIVYWKKYWWALPILLLLMACNPKGYPIGKPFVYQTQVKLNIELGNEQKKAIEEELYNYFDDSLKVQKKSILGFKKSINPPVFDTANIDRSKVFMKKYLNSLGYYRASFDTTYYNFDTVSAKEIHTKIFLGISAGKQLKFDSVWYDLKVPELQNLALETKEKTLMKKGEGYSKQRVGQELDRLVSLYRGKGYFKMIRNNLLAEFDTINKALVSTSNDPFLQFEEARKRRLNPTVDFRIYQRPSVDSSNFLKYTLGKVTIYPEAKINEEQDSMLADATYKVWGRNGVYIKTKEGLFTNKTVRRFASLQPGKFYNEEDYFKTINAYAQGGSWQQVDVKAVSYVDSTDTARVDLHIFLVPAAKYFFKTDLEGSFNINKVTSVDAATGSFFGVSIVTNLLNRNFRKTAIQWNNNLRGGLEINSKGAGSNGNIFQTVQFSGGTSFSIPRLWWPFKLFIKKTTAARTFLNVDAAYTSRQDYYNLSSLNFALGYEWKKKSNIFTIRIPNLEFVDLTPKPALVRLIQENPLISYSFNQGLVVGFGATFQKDIFYQNKPNQTSYLRLSAEQSGLLTGDKLFGKQVLRFAKFDAEWKHNLNFLKHKWAFRIIGGYGRSFDDSTTLPFFRQYIAGGANSLRAWKLRQLGLGSSLERDTSSSNFKDRLGDIYVEANAEYRFYVTKVLGFPIEGALFADVGNIWNRRLKKNINEDEIFKLKNFFEDLAIATGTGVRVDFGYLLLRFDIAYKIKDPVRGGNGWVKDFEWKSVNRLGKVSNNNFAFQVGINYPF